MGKTNAQFFRKNIDSCYCGQLNHMQGNVYKLRSDRIVLFMIEQSPLGLCKMFMPAHLPKIVIIIFAQKS